jgi:hypothetical protein
VASGELVKPALRSARTKRSLKASKEDLPPTPGQTTSVPKGEFSPRLTSPL